MSERTARLMERGAQGSESAEEAWESLKELREDTDWDPEAVRPAGSSSSEFRHSVAADD